MLPFLVDCEQPMPPLFELADGRFQRVTDEPLAPYMPGYQFLLVEAALAEFLDDLGVERVKFERAILWDPATQSEVTTHVRLRVEQFFDANLLSDLALDGLRLLTMNDQYYFVSSALKAELERSPFSYLRFSEGLSKFAAEAS